ncbi:MAG: hypothetical protein OEL56_00030 [Nitrosopumilus sp.]|nr:hypothetical protein [Nitrosopumilus sp.]MDH3515506.1 hypothetical protein [Nitrosopumilus sp.]MDH3565573.1 hypothetical protein [Nitrosopumilus sp.]MDH5416730.1 hypothetical protein [Nitrosopumilus sp.]MDH5555193.1 hypothetical protein [Nitrosopumilus sp.]
MESVLVIFGGNQDDFLFGNDGSDTIDRGNGKDELIVVILLYHIFHTMM